MKIPSYLLGILATPVLRYYIYYVRPGVAEATYETPHWGTACMFMKQVLNEGYTILSVRQEVRRATR